MNPRGFTLLEVLVSLAILVGGIVMISMAWSGSFMKMRKTNTAYDVATLLERKMVELESKYREKMNDMPEEGEKGDFGEDHPNYRWELKSRKLDFPDLTPLLVGQENGADEGLLGMVKQMTEYLGKTVKEMQVTIFVKTGRALKEQQFSATQYVIDYTQDFMGGMGAAGAAPGSATTGSGSGAGGGAGSTPSAPAASGGR